MATILNAMQSSALLTFLAQLHYSTASSLLYHHHLEANSVSLKYLFATTVNLLHSGNFIPSWKATQLIIFLQNFMETALASPLPHPRSPACQNHVITKRFRKSLFHWLHFLAQLTLGNVSPLPFV